MSEPEFHVEEKSDRFVAHNVPHLGGLYRFEIAAEPVPGDWQGDGELTRIAADELFSLIRSLDGQSQETGKPTHESSLGKLIYDHTTMDVLADRTKGEEHDQIESQEHHLSVDTVIAYQEDYIQIIQGATRTNPRTTTVNELVQDWKLSCGDWRVAGDDDYFYHHTKPSSVKKIRSMLLGVENKGKAACLARWGITEESNYDSKFSLPELTITPEKHSIRDDNLMTYLVNCGYIPFVQAALEERQEYGVLFGSPENSPFDWMIEVPAQFKDNVPVKYNSGIQIQVKDKEKTQKVVSLAVSYERTG